MSCEGVYTVFVAAKALDFDVVLSAQSGAVRG
jgi:hypothetical protein